jgi:hypothetical protein
VSTHTNSCHCRFFVKEMADREVQVAAMAVRCLVRCVHDVYCNDDLFGRMWYKERVHGYTLLMA